MLVPAVHGQTERRKARETTAINMVTTCNVRAKRFTTDDVCAEDRTVEDGEADGAGAAEDGQHRRIRGADGALSRPSPPVSLQRSHTATQPPGMTNGPMPGMAGTAGFAQARGIPCPCRSHAGARDPEHQPGQSPRTQVEEVDN